MVELSLQSSAVNQISENLMLRWSELLVIAEFLSPVTVQLVNTVIGLPVRKSHTSQSKGELACLRCLPSATAAAVRLSVGETETPDSSTVRQKRRCMYSAYCQNVPVKHCTGYFEFTFHFFSPDRLKYKSDVA
jgi:hypothetical protein